MGIGSIDSTLKRANKYIATSKRHINTLPNTEAKDDLLVLLTISRTGNIRKKGELGYFFVVMYHLRLKRF